MQLFREPGAGTAAPILGAVGPLQLEVLQQRMKTEYNVDLALTSLRYSGARWPIGSFDPEPFRYAETARASSRTARAARCSCSTASGNCAGCIALSCRARVEAQRDLLWTRRPPAKKFAGPSIVRS